MDFAKYTIEDLERSLETFKQILSCTGDLFHLNMVVAITEELDKRSKC